MKKIAVLFLSAAFGLCAFAQTTPAKLDELLNAYVADGKFNGSILVAEKGTVVYSKGFGFRDVENKVPNTENSIYQIGSITKQITAAVIMQLQQEGKLSVQDKLDKYFPGFPNGNKITIEHLLTHTSGLHNYTADTNIMKRDVTRHYSADEMITIFKRYAPDFEPGAKYSYSNSGYSMLGYIIEKVTGKSYESEVRRRIFKPLGMTHSGFDFTHLKDTARTKGYLVAGKPAPVVDSTISYSAGAVYSTVGDLYRWERGVRGGSILTDASWKKVFTPFRNKYGYGWSIDTLYARGVNSHGGSIHGYNSYLVRFPEDDVVVIAIDNTSSRHLTAISHAAAAVVLKQPYTVPQPKKEIQVDSGILKQYVGEYELAPGFAITIRFTGTGLTGQATGQNAFDLYPEKENLFFLKAVEAKVEFVRNEKSEVTEMILYQNGQQMKGKKIR